MQPEFFFLKYKKILAPFEVINKSTDIGWKIRKNYIKWNEVHCSPQSKHLLREIADDLIDKNYLNPKTYHELSAILTRVQSWALDTENPNYELHTLVIPQYEKFERAIKNGSLRPGLVDQIISDKNFEINKIKEQKRWILFVSLETIDYFKNQKRFEKILSEINYSDYENNYDATLELSVEIIKKILIEYCLDTSAFKKTNEKIIEVFLSSLDLPIKPENIDRKNTEVTTSRANVLIEYIEANETVFVKFEIFEGQLIVKINNNHQVFKSNDIKFKIYNEKSFWENVGDSTYSNLGKIDAIQAFFTTLGLKLSDD